MNDVWTELAESRARLRETIERRNEGFMATAWAELEELERRHGRPDLRDSDGRPRLTLIQGGRDD